MKIVVVASSIVPGNSLGIEHFTYRLLNALVDNHKEHKYIVLIPKGTLQAWRLRVPPKNNVTFVPIKISASIRSTVATTQLTLSNPVYLYLKKQKIFRFIFHKLKQYELGRVIRFQNPDIVYTPLHIEALVFGPWKTVLSVHDLREIMPEFYEREKAELLKKNLAKTEGIIVAWRHPYGQLIENFPLYKPKTHLIPFPIPITRNRNKYDPGSSGQKEIILFASALREQKNHINLLKAMPKIIKSRSSKEKEILLVCAGTFHYPLYDNLLNEVSKIGIQQNVLFTGFISDEELERWYEKSTVIVTPTLWEAASGAVFEAFLFQKPVACSRIAPIISQVEQSNAHVNYFEPNDPNDIARSILEVLENPTPYIEGAQRGAKFLQSLTWESTAHQYIQVFRQVLSLMAT